MHAPLATDFMVMLLLCHDNCYVKYHAWKYLAYSWRLSPSRRATLRLYPALEHAHCRQKVVYQNAGICQRSELNHVYAKKHFELWYIVTSIHLLSRIRWNLSIRRNSLSNCSCLISLIDLEIGPGSIWPLPSRWNVHFHCFRTADMFMFILAYIVLVVMQKTDWPHRSLQNPNIERSRHKSQPNNGYVNFWNYRLQAKQSDRRQNRVSL